METQLRNQAKARTHPWNHLSVKGVRVYQCKSRHQVYISVYFKVYKQHSLVFVKSELAVTGSFNEVTLRETLKRTFIIMYYWKIFDCLFTTVALDCA